MHHVYTDFYQYCVMTQQSQTHGPAATPTKQKANESPSSTPIPFRRIKISAKYSERWSVPTAPNAPHQGPEDCGSLTPSKQWSLRHPLKKEEDLLSMEKNAAASPDKLGILSNEINVYWFMDLSLLFDRKFSFSPRHTSDRCW